MNRAIRDRSVRAMQIASILLVGLLSSPQQILGDDAANQVREITTLKGHGGAVLCVAFSPDGRLLASGSFGRAVRLWDVELRKEVATLKGHGLYVHSVAFSPDGRLLAVGSTGTIVKLWDVGRRTEIATLKGEFMSRVV